MRRGLGSVPALRSVPRLGPVFRLGPPHQLGLRWVSLAVLWWALATSTLAAEEPDPIQVTREMRAWVLGHVLSAAPFHLSEPERLRRLWQAMTAPDGLALREEPGATRSAAESFELRRGDCVAFAHLFVALGRELGARVGFVAFTSPEEMEEVGAGEAPAPRHASLRIATGHLAAGWMGADGTLWVFDFGGVSRSPWGARWISDAGAAAIYHSNLGVAALLAQRNALAIRHLERAVGLAPRMPVVWVNLGVARRRLGDVEGAVAAYRRALALEPGSPAAQSNLRAAR